MPSNLSPTQEQKLQEQADAETIIEGLQASISNSLGVIHNMSALQADKRDLAIAKTLGEDFLFRLNRAVDCEWRKKT